MSELKRYAFIENGFVKNIIVADEEYIPEDGFVECGESIRMLDTYENGIFGPPSLGFENKADWSSVLSKRDELLQECSLYSLEDIERMTEQEQDAWGKYHYALTTLEENYDSPEEVVWPTKPEPPSFLNQ